MDSGIYALYWWEQDLVYIGLSSTLAKRHKEHIRLLTKESHPNYKVQNAFDSFGYPEFIVLEYCSIHKLPEREIVWCNEFNALGPNGLCLVEPGIVGFGTNSNSSKYSKVQILKVFALLYKGALSISKISERLGIPKSLIRDIRSGRTHRWLKEDYPDKYLLMCGVKVRALVESNKEVRAIIAAPDGSLHEISSVTEFCLKHFGSKTDKKHMASVITGGRKSHKGYRLHKIN